MPRPRQGGQPNGEVIDAEVTTIASPSGGMVPYSHSQQSIMRPRNTPRSNIGDGGYFDASGKRKPIFMISTADDQMAALMAVRAWLSAFRHKPLQTVGVTGASLWFGFFGLSGALNMLRGDVLQCSGDNWNPVVAGCNMAAAIAGPAQGLAGNVHDVMLGQDEVTQDIETSPKIRAVKVDDQ
ncbi:MAG: hypothetical protein F6J95_023845 [Leptolyngbya sp. SIO1E4]|nr:hypothetical protein [Leptolyngbya sp. SIO1E4]